MKFASFGGATTFNGIAANRLRETHPTVFDEVIYLPTVDELWPALEKGEVEAICTPNETTRTGFSDTNKRLAEADGRFYVLGEVAATFGASLLVKPGTRLEDIRKITGHGMSTANARPWLAQHVPQAEIVIHPVSSVEAAKEVTASDGKVASVGTPQTAQLLGLEELAKNIDGGTHGNFCAVSTKPVLSDTPHRVVVVGRFGGDGQVGDLAVALSRVGYRLSTAFSQTSGRALYEYDYVFKFSGQGKLASVQDELKRFPAARLVGAFQVRE